MNKSLKHFLNLIKRQWLKLTKPLRILEATGDLLWNKFPKKEGTKKSKTSQLIQNLSLYSRKKMILVNSSSITYQKLMKFSMKMTRFRNQLKVGTLMW